MAKIEQVRKALQSANSNLAKGALSNNDRTWALSDTDQLFKAYEYEPLVVGGHAGGTERVRSPHPVPVYPCNGCIQRPANGPDARSLW
jgi:multidrug efflux pump subunit AcrB